MILSKTLNLLMPLIRHRGMTKNFLVFMSTCLSPYALSGMEYQEISVGFIFPTIPRLEKRQSCISELISLYMISMFSGRDLLPKTPESGGITWLRKQ